MSLSDQAFVKAFARRNRHNDKSSKTVTETKPTPIDEMTLDRRVADTASMWIDSSEGVVARGDSAQAEVPRPHIEPAANTTRPTPVKPATAVKDTPAPTVARKEVTRQDVAAPLPSETDTVDDIARLVASLQQIHTTYGSIDASSTDFSWDETVDLRASESVAPKASQDTSSALAEEAEPSIAPEQTQQADVQPAKRASTPFQAAWEVDVFDVPKTVADLFFNESLFQDLTDRMGEAVKAGLRTMLVTSVNKGEGRSSVAIGMAMAAAASGARVALLDADIDDPTLADDLRLELEHGWLDTLRSGLSVKEVAVYAVEDAVTLIPLIGVNAQRPATANEIAHLVDSLRERFDLVVIDGPAGDSVSLQPFATSIDSAIIVRDSLRTTSDDVESFAGWLTRSGVQGVGMVENFIS
ncbi:P-loop NTPase [Rubripirellula reticaptiva]|uniref:Septum site-determining protein MinD n=1 Tax=Rubripirellula reticaptiva TaxID=2528013 RepID=A0A5C6FAT6_9BACT|nr:P-loop NTPase [Rubripirellula reticaptiva]TWU57474.1 Septum site-determining protein MinD [Rubripirellula reticaptiva]